LVGLCIAVASHNDVVVRVLDSLFGTLRLGVGGRVAISAASKRSLKLLPPGVVWGACCEVRARDGVVGAFRLAFFGRGRRGVPVDFVVELGRWYAGVAVDVEGLRSSSSLGSSSSSSGKPP
jgi:hypothetical protein